MRTQVDQLEPGMEVAVDVMNVNNMLLIPKGTLLTARHIRLLKTWGVETVGIVNESAGHLQAVTAEIPPEILQAAESYVDNRFSRITAMTDTMKIIKSLAVQRAALRLFRQSLAANPESPA